MMKTRATAMDVDLFLDTRYCGFYPISRIEEYFAAYEEKAESYVSQLDWDEVLLYAIYAYDKETQGIISADFMLLRMPYARYVRLCAEISENCRLFFKRNK